MNAPHNIPERTHIDGFFVAGVSTRTNNANEFNPKTAQIPTLWAVYRIDAVANDIVNQISNSPTYGVYHRYASDANGDYSVTAGVAVVNTALTVEEENIDTIQVMAGDYLVFRALNIDSIDMGQAVVQLWQAVWDYFNAHPDIRRAYQTDFEEYSTDGVAVYVGVR